MSVPEAATASEPPAGSPGSSLAASRAIGWLLVGLFSVLAIGEHILFAYTNGAVLKEGGLVDTDSFMRVLRVLDLYNGVGWYNTITPRLDAPEGLSLHWTRPVDLLILLPALLAHALGAPIDRAVYWIGAAFSTACHILACLAVAWAAKPLWPSPGHRFAALILLTNSAAFGYGIFGRADHHTLLLLLTVLMLGAMLRVALGNTPAPEQRRWAVLGGLAAGFGVWVSPEFLVPVVPVILTLGLFWIDDPLDARDRGVSRDWARPGALFSLAMAAVVLVAIPIEQPPARWLAAEYDKISIPYLVLPLIWAGVFAAARATPSGLGMRGFAMRAAAGLALGAAGAALLLSLFPNLLLGPLSVDTRLKVDFLDNIQEMQPLWPSSLDRLRVFLPMAGQAVTAIVLLPFAFRRWGGDKHWAALLISVAFGFMLIGALMHARLGVEFAPTAAIICAGFFRMAEDRLHKTKRVIRTPLLVLAATLLTVGPMLSSLIVPPPASGDTCKVHDLANWLNTAHPGIGPAPIILTDDFSYSPELAFRTDYRFVAGPYHRGPQGIFDTIDAMTDVDGRKAKEILDRRQVALVVRCGDVIIPRLFNSSAFNFYARIGGRGTLPDWLTPLDLPPGLSKHFKVYEVKGR